MAISIEGEMARESHTIEAMVHGYHVYKEMWCAAVGEVLPCVRESGERWPCPSQSRIRSHENLRIGFYFVGLIFVVYQSTVKTAKTGPLENFPLYGTSLVPELKF